MSETKAIVNERSMQSLKKYFNFTWKIMDTTTFQVDWTLYNTEFK